MAGERWFPINHDLGDRLKLYKLLSTGESWQIYSSGHNSRALIAKPNLVERWVTAGLLDLTSFTEVSFGSEGFYVIGSGNDYQLAPVAEFISPESKADASAFAASLRQSRQIAKEASFHDAIYVERLSRLLPTWTVSEKVSDEKVLGSWLTGGVLVSTSSFRRITNLLAWLNKSDVRDVIQLAGLEIPKDTGVSQYDRLQFLAEPEAEDKEPAQQGSQTRRKETIESNIPTFKLSGRVFLEEFFTEHVIDIVLHEDRYKALGINFPTAVLLHGPPGCGKTFAVERLVEFLDWPVFHIESNSVGSPYIHETSRKVSEIFEKAMDHSPAVIVIDEMEAFLSDRQLHQSTGLHHVEEVAEFLRRIPDAASNRVLVIGMTNRLEMIDPAILRRGRFDHVIEVGMPSKQEVSELVTSLIGKIPVDGDLSIEDLVSTLEGRPLSDASFAVREAGRLAARDGKTKIDQAALDAALAKLPDTSDERKGRPIGFVWN